ncbi:MAG: hypothetical protein KBA31_10520 [Alphaproteobacteria bacterium]|nr:hypothetical protein [Alphaproteobacteria bacterium]
MLRALAVAFVVAAGGFVLLSRGPSVEKARSSPVSLNMIQGFLGQTNNSSPSRKFTRWEDRLAEELRAAPDVRHAAEKLAPEFGLTVAHAEQLIVAWVRWMHAEHAIAPPSYQRPASGNVAAVLYELVRKSSFDPRVIKLAAPIVENLDGCTAATLDRLTSGATRKGEAVWAAANASEYCAEWWIALNKLQPMNDAVLWGTVRAVGRLRPSAALSILEHLERTTANAQLMAVQAKVFKTSLSQHYLQALFDAGLVREAADYFLGLPESIRRALLDEETPEVVVKLGGHDVALNENADILTFSYMQRPAFRLEISAVLYLSGRIDEARAIFKTVLPPGSKRAFQRCGHLIGKPRETVCVDDATGGPIRWRLLEFALEKPQEDPYELVESEYGSATGADALGTGLWHLVSLRRLVEYRTPVAEFASRWDGDRVLGIDNMPVSDLLAATFEPSLVARAKEIARSIALVRKQFPPAADRGGTRRGDRSLRDAERPSRFRQVELPEDCPAPKVDPNWKAPTVPATINRISEIEQFWRVESAGSLVVVVGQMWSGGIWEEEGLGGVWIHISQDGGRTWEMPLYTDLEFNERFMVSAGSCVSRLDGDHLILESWLEPFGSAGQQAKAPGSVDARLAIDIPLSTLKRDSDRDGLTDIVEEALRLNPRNRDSDSDGIADGEDSFPNLGNEAANEIAGPMATVLSGVVNGAGQPHKPAMIAAKAGTEIVPLRFKERPLILFADPRIFGGISADRMVLVFAAQDLRRLAWRRSRISGTQFKEPVLNRARNRGYVKFDNGLTGGTFAWRREGAGWKVEQVRSFIR